MARAVLNQADISRALTRISHEILESNRGSSDLVLLGIPTRGVILARRIAETIARIEPDAPPALAGALDVTMYRDDLGRTRTRTATTDAATPTTRSAIPPAPQSTCSAASRGWLR